jgi:hypothetical protein
MIRAMWVFLAALCFYLWTLSPSVGWGDAVRLQMDAAMKGSTYWFFDEANRTTTDGWPFQYLGVAAWDHPLYVMLAQLFLALPFNDIPWRINLMSAVFAALAVAGVFVVARRLTSNEGAALLATAALAVSHTFWFHAVTAEVYSLYAFLMVIVIGVALSEEELASPRTRWACACVAGAATANHLLFVLTVAIVGVHLARGHVRLSRPDWMKTAGAFLLGFSPWWIQFFRMSHAVGFLPTLQAATGLPVLGERVWASSSAAALGNIASYAAWLMYQFTPFGVAVGIVGFARLRKDNQRAFEVLLSLFAVHALFSANYQVPDRFAFHLFSYVVFAIVMSAGFNELMRFLDRLYHNRHARLMGATCAVVGATLLPVAMYAAIPPTFHAAGITDAAIGIPPIGAGARDGINYFLNPNRRGDDSATRFGRETLKAVAPGALVIAPKESDQEAYLVLRYFQLVEHRRRDVYLDLLLSEPTSQVPNVILARVRALAGCRPLYFASLNARFYPIAAVKESFAVTPEANLYRVRPTNGAGACDHTATERRVVPVNALVQEALRKR